MVIASASMESYGAIDAQNINLVAHNMHHISTHSFIIKIYLKKNKQTNINKYLLLKHFKVAS